MISKAFNEAALKAFAPPACYSLSDDELYFIEKILFVLWKKHPEYNTSEYPYACRQRYKNLVINGDANKFSSPV